MNRRHDEPGSAALTLMINHGRGKNGPTLWVYGRRNDGLRSRTCEWRPEVTRSSVIGRQEQKPVRRTSLSGGRHAANDRAPSFPGEVSCVGFIESGRMLPRLGRG